MNSQDVSKRVAGGQTDYIRQSKQKKATGKIPVFGFWDFSIGKEKAIGGLVTTAKSQGKADGKMVNEIARTKLTPPKS